jgi:hypothetical protein
MTDREHAHDVKPSAGSVCALAATGAIALIVGCAAFVVPRPADALPSYAQQTGLACGRCHVSPAGGGPRTSFGNAFAANGHKVPAKPAKTTAGGGAPSSSSTAAPTTPSPVVTGGGGYYSSIVNPRFGYVPELGYSNGVFFRIYPHSD